MIRASAGKSTSPSLRRQPGAQATLRAGDLEDARRGLGFEVDGVGLGEVLPLVRDGVLGEDGAHRADRLAGPAVDALVRIDVVLGASSSEWMQSTGQTSTHEASFTPMQGSVMTYVIRRSLFQTSQRRPLPWRRPWPSVGIVAWSTPAAAALFQMAQRSRGRETAPLRARPRQAPRRGPWRRSPPPGRRRPRSSPRRRGGSGRCASSPRSASAARGSSTCCWPRG